MSQPETAETEMDEELGPEEERVNWQTDEAVDYKSQTKRLEEIHRARERVIEKKHETEAGLATQSITEYEARTILRSAVEDYILEVAPIIKGHEEHDHYWDGDEDEPLGTFTLPDGEKKTIVGLEDLIDAPNPYVSFSESVPPPPPGWAKWPEHRLREVKSAERSETQIPREILISARSVVDEMLYEVGLDIRLKEDMHETRIDQELLDKVAEWREQNLE